MSSMTPRVQAVVDALRGKTVDEVHGRLKRELRTVERPRSDDLHENALLVTALREAKIWPPEVRR